MKSLDEIVRENYRIADEEWFAKEEIRMKRCAKAGQEFEKLFHAAPGFVSVKFRCKHKSYFPLLEGYAPGDEYVVVVDNHDDGTGRAMRYHVKNTGTHDPDGTPIYQSHERWEIKIPGYMG